ncbi:unnamed protein product, partial [Notodromas monacha]
MNGSRLPLSLVEDLSRMRLTHAAGDYASDARKVAPVVPPKPRKPAGCQEECDAPPQVAPRKDPPAYHEPHIFQPTPS